MLVGMIQVLQPNGVTSLSDYDGVTRYLDIKTGCGMCIGLTKKCMCVV